MKNVVFGKMKALIGKVFSQGFLDDVLTSVIGLIL